MRRLFLLTLALSLGVQPLAGQPGLATTVLAPAAVFDGVSPVAHRDWIVVMSRGTINYAGPERAGVVPAGARRHVLPGLTLLPGLIDAHVHLFLHPYDEASWDDQVLKESVALRIARATAHARNTLLAGFTTVRDLGTEGAGYADAGLREAIATGVIPGPRLITSSKAIVATGSYAPARTRYAYETPLGAEEADAASLQRVIRDQIGHGADWIKIYGDARWGPGGAIRPTFSAEEMTLAARTIRDSGRELVVHASNPESMRRAALAGAKTIEHGDHGTLDAFRQMAKAGTAYCPTLAASEAVASYEGWSRARGDAVPPAVLEKRRSFENALRSGVTICTGSDAGVFTHGDNVRELLLMRDYGMKTIDVLRSATSVTAKAIGLGDVGRIAPGFKADVIAVEGDPLADLAALRNVRFVMKQGEIFRNESRATR